MEHENRIAEAFETSEIKKILLIDDAYDTPDIDDNVIGILLDFLEGAAGQATCLGIGIEEEKLATAVQALHEGDHENNHLVAIYEKLYKQFVETENSDFDPGEKFLELKGPALNALKPLHKLLNQCGEDIQVRTVGLKSGSEFYRKFQPQVLFLDYYLDSDIPVTGDISAQQRNEARQTSLQLLSELVTTNNEQDIPSVVLMSSRAIEDVDEYRHEAGSSQILALRFGFFKKKPH